MKKSIWRFGCAAALAFLLSQTGPLIQSSFAQKLVDPDSVAPAFRAAAEKRRAEQLKLNECTRKANVAKVLVRDRAGFIPACPDSPNETANEPRGIFPARAPACPARRCLASAST